MAHVQSVTGANGATGGLSSVSSSVGSAVGSGNTVVCLVTYGSGVTAPTVKDNQSNSYTAKDTVTDTINSQSMSSFILGNITNGPDQLTATFPGSNGSFVSIVWDEYNSALAAADPSDGHNGLASNIGTGTNAILSGTFTTTANGDTVWSGVGCDSGSATTVTAGTTTLSYTLRGRISTVEEVDTEDAHQTTAGSGTEASFTQSLAQAVCCVAIAIKPAAIATPVLTIPRRMYLRRRVGHRPSPLGEVQIRKQRQVLVFPNGRIILPSGYRRVA
jgi:hypothetical protein